jgi:Phosphatidylinositol 3- and 4-kinase.
MTPSRFTAALALGVLLVAGGQAVRAAQETAAPAPVNLTPEQMEKFLLQAKILKTRSAGNGVTNSLRATLSDGQLTHDAHVQFIDEARTTFEAGKASEINFKDSYRYNIAGYRLGLLLGLNVPMSVERSVNGKTSAVTWWIDDVAMDEESRVKNKRSAPDQARFRRQIQTMRIFDELIQNKDRNQGNIVWTKDWNMWMIDHTRAFRLRTDLLNPQQLERCDRALLTKLKGLTRESLTEAVAKSLTKDEIAALLARRDKIVKLYEKRIADLGENAVLYADAVPAT